MNHTVKDIDLVQPVYCKDCRFAVLAQSTCTHEQAKNKMESLVDGVRYYYTDTDKMRYHGPCGKEGSLFQPKPWWRKLL